MRPSSFDCKKPYFFDELNSTFQAPLRAEPPANLTASAAVAGLPPFWSYIACGILSARSTLCRGYLCARLAEEAPLVGTAFFAFGAISDSFCLNGFAVRAKA